MSIRGELGTYAPDESNHEGHMSPSKFSPDEILNCMSLPHIKESFDGWGKGPDAKTNLSLDILPPSLLSVMPNFTP